MMRAIILALLLLAGQAWATTLEVPSQYSTILAAVAAVSADGDVINVAAGTYHETDVIGYIAYDFTIQGATGTRTDVVISGAGSSNIGLRVAAGQTLTLQDLTFEEDATNGYGYMRVEAGATLAMSNVWIDITEFNSHIVALMATDAVVTPSGVKISSDNGWENAWTYWKCTSVITWDDCEFVDIAFRAGSSYPAGPVRFVDCTFTAQTDDGSLHPFIDFSLPTAIASRITIDGCSFTGLSSAPNDIRGLYRRNLTVDADTVMNSTFDTVGYGVYIYEPGATSASAEHDYFGYNTFYDCVNYGIGCGANYSIIRGNIFYERPTFGNTSYWHSILLGVNDRTDFSGDVGAFNIVAGNYVNIGKGYLVVDKGNDNFVAGNKGIITGAGACFMVKGAPRGRYVANYFSSATYCMQLSQQNSIDPVDYTVASNYFDIVGTYAIYNENVTAIDGAFGLNLWAGTPSTAFYYDGPATANRTFNWWQTNTHDKTDVWPATRTWTDEPADSLIVIGVHSGYSYAPASIGRANHYGGGWQ